MIVARHEVPGITRKIASSQRDDGTDLGLEIETSQKLF